MKSKSGKSLLKYLILSGSLMASFIAYAGSPPMTLDIKLLTMDTAVKIANASIEKCRKEGAYVTVTVVDRSGHPLIVMRDTLAMDISIPISLDKAYTSMTFNRPNGELVGRFARDSVTKMDGLIVARGGLPINAGGHNLGGVGVSGSPSGELDEACAKAGLDAVMNDLEMSL